jgi:hypothetical protein
MTPAQNKRLHQLLARTGRTPYKAELVGSFTGGRSGSSKDLSVDEAQMLISHLEGLLKNSGEALNAGLSGTPAKKGYLDMKPDERMRRKIFGLCREMGYIDGDTKEDRKLNQVIVYGIVERKGYLNKPLMQYSTDELVKLVSQFEAMKRNNQKQAARTAVVRLLEEMNIQSMYIESYKRRNRM